MADDSSDSVQLATYPYPDHRVQPTGAPQGFTALPVETIYHILRFLDPQDLIRLQAVSKLLHVIVDDTAVWRTAYSIHRLVLPSGPFSWQSTQFLRRTLVQSARLACGWTTEPPTLVSSKIYSGPRSTEDDKYRWVCGRWLIESKDKKQLVSRDIVTGSEQVLWDHGTFGFWVVVSVTNTLGHFVYIAVHLGKGDLSDPVKLVEVVANDDTGHLSAPEILDVPTWALPSEGFVPRIRLDSGLAPYAYVSLCSANKPRQSLIFHPLHRRFYKFPVFRTQLDLLLNYRGAWLPHLVEVYFTETHLLVLNRSYLIHGSIGNVEVIQIFAFPDVDPDPDRKPELTRDTVSDSPAPSNRKKPEPVVYELRLTHEILSRDTGSLWLTPIRNATVDPATRATTLRFLHTYAPFQHSPVTRVRLVCTDYVLPAPRPAGPARAITKEDASADPEIKRDPHALFNRNLGAIRPAVEPILPIVVASHDVFSVQGVWQSNVVDASDDGFVRGLCVIHRYGEASPYPDLGTIHKFSVDATGPRCVAVVGDPCPPWVGFKTTRSYQWAFDGARGKLWTTKEEALELDPKQLPEGEKAFAVLIDFK